MSIFALLEQQPHSGPQNPLEDLTASSLKAIHTKYYPAASNYDEVYDDCMLRLQMGSMKYNGYPVVHGDRAYQIDLYQELLDAINYSLVIMQEECIEPSVVAVLVDLAAALLKHLNSIGELEE